jgi:hypothetical protein
MKNVNSLPIVIRTCDIYEVADFHDLEGATWALLQAVMVHELSLEMQPLPVDKSVDSSSSSTNHDGKREGEGSYLPGLNSIDQIRSLVKAYARRIFHTFIERMLRHSLEKKNASISTSSTTETASSIIIAAEAFTSSSSPPPPPTSALTAHHANDSSHTHNLHHHHAELKDMFVYLAAAEAEIMPRLPVLKDTGRALTIFPVGREPGEVRVLIIEATGLGALSPDDGGRSERMIGEDDDNESAERSMTTPLSISSSSKKGSEVKRPALSSFSKAIVKALTRKGVKVDHSRLSSFLRSDTRKPSSSFSSSSSSSSSSSIDNYSSSNAAAANAASLRSALGLDKLTIDPSAANEPTPYWEQGREIGEDAASPSAGPLLDVVTLASFKRYGAPAHLLSASSRSASVGGGVNKSKKDKKVEEKNDDHDDSMKKTSSSSSSTLKSKEVATQPLSLTPQAFAVLRCGLSEVQTDRVPIKKQKMPSSSSASLLSNTASSTGSSTATPGISQGGGACVSPWRELVTFKWDGISSVSMTLWCVPLSTSDGGGNSNSSSGGGATTTSSTTTPTDGVPIAHSSSLSSSSSIPFNSSSSKNDLKSSLCIGTGSLSVMGLSPGLPQRVSVPITTRVKVRVPVLHNPHGPCVCRGAAAAKKAAKKANASSSSSSLSSIIFSDDVDSYTVTRARTGTAGSRSTAYSDVTSDYIEEEADDAVGAGAESDDFRAPLTRCIVWPSDIS